MFVLRALAAVSAVLLVSVMALGCGSGLSKGDADVRCDQEKAALGFSADVYASCEACYEQCGDSCVRRATTPITYSCSGDTSTSTGTGGSNGG